MKAQRMAVAMCCRQDIPRDDAEDIAMQAIEARLSTFDRTKGTEFSTWVVETLGYRIADWKRANTIQADAHLDVSTVASPTQDPSEYAECKQNVVEHYEERKAIQAALAELTERAANAAREQPASAHLRALASCLAGLDATFFFAEREWLIGLRSEKAPTSQPYLEALEGHSRLADKHRSELRALPSPVPEAAVDIVRELDGLASLEAKLKPGQETLLWLPEVINKRFPDLAPADESSVLQAARQAKAVGASPTMAALKAAGMNTDSIRAAERMRKTRKNSAKKPSKKSQS